MERAALKQLWEKTVGPQADFSALDSLASFKPLFALHFESDPPPLTMEPLELIGRGGMGVVYRAIQPGLEREVALKRLRAEKAQSSEARASFLAEAVVTGRLEHPNIVPVYALARGIDGEEQLAMKLIGGQSWKQLFDAEPELQLVRHLEILLQVCNALAFAHSRNIVHCDLKPSNVMLGSFGEVLLVDWGLAVDISPEPPDETSRLRHRSSIDIPCGTPSYMAPELAMGRGSAIGPWTDVYLLGATLYRILSGLPPHAGSSLLETVGNACDGVHPDLPETAPEGLRKLCLRAMALEPSDRHSNVAAFQQELRDFLRHRQSLLLAETAQAQLEVCQQRAAGKLDDSARTQLYQSYNEALAGFHQARRLWHENPKACEGEQATRRSFARSALQHGDLGLAAVHLQELQSEDVGALRAEWARRRARKTRDRRMRRRLAGALGLALLAFVVLLVGGLLQLDAKNQEIERQAQSAELRGRIAEQALGTLVGEVQDELLDDLGDSEARRVARRVLALSRSSWQQLRDAHLSERSSARGAVWANLQLSIIAAEVDGDLSGAWHLAKAVTASLRRLVVADTSDLGVRRELATALTWLGSLQRQRGQSEAAFQSFSESVHILETLSASTPGVPAQTADLLGHLAQSLVDLGRRSEARQVLLQALEIERSLEEEGRRGLLAMLQQYGDLELRLERVEEAFEAHGEALRLWERQRAASPLSRREQRAYALALLRVGQIEGWLGAPQARAHLEQALEIQRLLVAIDGSHASLRRDLQLGLLALGELCAEHGEPGDAQRLFAEALEHARVQVQQDSTDARARRDLAAALERIGNLHLAQGRTEEAARVFAEDRSERERLLQLDPSNPRAQRDLSVAIENCADAELYSGRPNEAERGFAAVVATRRALAAMTPGDPQAFRDLSVALEKLSDARLADGRPTEAWPPLAESLELAEQGGAVELPPLCRKAASLQRLLGQAEGAEQFEDRELAALAELEQLQPEASWAMVRFQVLRERAAQAVTRKQSARAMTLLRAARVCGVALLDEHPELARALEEIEAVLTELE